MKTKDGAGPSRFADRSRGDLRPTRVPATATHEIIAPPLPPLNRPRRYVRAQRSAFSGRHPNAVPRGRREASRPCHREVAPAARPSARALHGVPHRGFAIDRWRSARKDCRGSPVGDSCRQPWIQDLTFFIVHGSRWARVSRASASASSKKRSASGFQRSLRPSIIAMLPMCATVMVRWPTSAGA